MDDCPRMCCNLSTSRWNSDGQLGHGDMVIRTEPTLVEGITETIAKVGWGPGLMLRLVPRQLTKNLRPDYLEP